MAPQCRGCVGRLTSPVAARAYPEKRLGRPLGHPPTGRPGTGSAPGPLESNSPGRTPGHLRPADPGHSAIREIRADAHRDDPRGEGDRSRAGEEARPGDRGCRNRHPPPVRRQRTMHHLPRRGARRYRPAHGRGREGTAARTKATSAPISGYPVRSASSRTWRSGSSTARSRPGFPPDRARRLSRTHGRAATPAAARLAQLDRNGAAVALRRRVRSFVLLFLGALLAAHARRRTWAPHHEQR